MNYLEYELPGRFILILGALSTIAFILVAVWIAKLYSKKRNIERSKF